jgi:GH24 family phage-related lysozyme (muramidase)
MRERGILTTFLRLERRGASSNELLELPAWLDHPGRDELGRLVDRDEDEMRLAARGHGAGG